MKKALINHKIPVARKILRQGVSNELCKLMKGGNGIKGTNTIHLILMSKIPKNKRACFLQWVVDIQLKKYVQMTAAGHFLEEMYTEKTSQLTLGR